APGNGGVYSRSAKARIHPTIPLSGRFKLLLRGLRPCIDYPQLTDHPTTLSSSPGPCRPRRTLWSQGLHEAGPAECIQPRSFTCGKQVEDGLYYTHGALRVP
ncbi:hypothetical protein M9458_008033, partial [Cirrhinus mrigala]